jgi:hypothetical protein
MGLAVALAELRAEALQGLDLFVRELHGPLGQGLFEPQQAILAAEQAMAAPDTAHAVRADLDAGQC